MRNNRLLQEELELIVLSLISEAFVAMFAAADYRPRKMKGEKIEVINIVTTAFISD